jgi:hypothetical protein
MLELNSYRLVPLHQVPKGDLVVIEDRGKQEIALRVDAPGGPAELRPSPLFLDREFLDDTRSAVLIGGLTDHEVLHLGKPVFAADVRSLKNFRRPGQVPNKRELIVFEGGLALIGHIGGGPFRTYVLDLHSGEALLEFPEHFAVIGGWSVGIRDVDGKFVALFSTGKTLGDLLSEHA